MKTSNQNIPEVSFSLNRGQHTRGTPYPEIDFSAIQKFGLKSETGAIACSNEELIKQIDAQYDANPNSMYATYFYFTIRYQN
jgi:hypothetical protein